MLQQHLQYTVLMLMAITVLLAIYFFIYLERTTTRASPIGIPRDIYNAYCKLE